MVSANVATTSRAIVTNAEPDAAALAAIERARRTPVVISRQHRRAPGRTRFSFRPRLRVRPSVSMATLVREARHATDTPHEQ